MNRADAFDDVPDDLTDTARWLTSRLDTVAAGVHPQRPAVESVTRARSSGAQGRALAIAAAILLVVGGLGAAAVARRQATLPVAVESGPGTSIGTTSTTLAPSTACPGEKARLQAFTTVESKITATSEAEAVAAFAADHGFAADSFRREPLPDGFKGLVTMVTADTVPADGTPPGTSTSRNITDEIPWYVHASPKGPDLAIYAERFRGGLWVVYQAVGCPTTVRDLHANETVITSPSTLAPAGG